MAGLIDDALVSVIIVNYNGINFIESCLNSILASDYRNLEIVLVDNASSDGSVDLVRNRFNFEKRIKIIVNNVRVGPAKGRNIGIVHSRGEFIVFLDNDTEVDAHWLSALVLAVKEDSRIGAAQSKLLLSDRKTIDSCGHYLSIIGFPYEIGAGEIDRGQYDKIMHIFGARSAAMFIRRAVLEEIGYFDPDYFIYSEETDLCWRVWMHNYRIVYVPSSVVYHRRGGSLNGGSRYLIFYEGAKNCTKTLIKNLSLQKLLFILPLHILSWMTLSIVFILKGRTNDARGILKGLLWDVVNMRKMCRNRIRVQERRVVRDSQISGVMFGNFSTPDLVKKGLSWLGRI